MTCSGLDGNVATKGMDLCIFSGATDTQAITRRRAICVLFFRTAGLQMDIAINTKDCVAGSISEANGKSQMPKVQEGA